MIPKFRAWIKAEERMTTVLGIDLLLKEVVVPKEGAEEIRELLFDSDWFDYDEVVLMQSTGLLDIYDKDIFDGDVLYDVGFDITYDVVYCPAYARFELHEITKPSDSGDVLNFPDFIYSNEYLYNKEIRIHLQIIGNIYENPELLEG